MIRHWFLLLLLVSPAWGGEPLSPEAPVIGPGELDVEANVRKMLEESRARQGEAAHPDTAQPRVAPPVVSPRPAPSPALNPAAEAKPATVRAKPAAGSESYIPVPEETITIRSVEDVQSVQQQLQEARRRKAGESSAPEDPNRK